MVSGYISSPVTGATVTLTYVMPDGTTFSRTVKTASDGSYGDPYKPEATGVWKITASWNGDTIHHGSSESTYVNVKKSGCLIATATYGSELSTQVQFLRDFRDNSVLKTFAGFTFMVVFYTWYYSFSPVVASSISDNEALREAMKGILYPLIGILQLSYGVSSLFSFNSEIGIMLAGLVASVLISLVYFTPWTFLLIILGKLKPSAERIHFTALVWVGSIAIMALAEATMSPPLMMISSGAFVLTTICLTSLAAVGIVSNITMQDTGQCG